MKDIQFNQNLSKEEWEDLHETLIDELQLSVRASNALKRAGYFTIGELADASSKEVTDEIESLEYYKDNVQRREKILKVIFDKLDEAGIKLPTEEEKQNILDSLTETQRLQREINILQYKLDKEIEMRKHYEEVLQQKQEAVNKERERIFKEASDIVKNSKYPVETMIERMWYGTNHEAGCSFCKLFNLFNEVGCQIEEDLYQHIPLKNADSCARCIEKFLLKYYGKEKTEMKEIVDDNEGDYQDDEFDVIEGMEFDLIEEIEISMTDAKV